MPKNDNSKEKVEYPDVSKEVLEMVKELPSTTEKFKEKVIEDIDSSYKTYSTKEKLKRFFTGKPNRCCVCKNEIEDKEPTVGLRLGIYRTGFISGLYGGNSTQMHLICTQALLIDEENPESDLTVFETLINCIKHESILMKLEESEKDQIELEDDKKIDFKDLEEFE